MNRHILAIAVMASTVSAADAGLAQGRTPAYDALVAKHAQANGVPETLVHRIIVRESRYNPRAVSKGNYGLMQIRLGTAKGMGYRGTPAGLLDADTNMTYAVRYLANAYKVAGGNHERAVSLYAGGYYYVAKRKGMLSALKGPLVGRTTTIASVGSEPQANALATRVDPTSTPVANDALSAAMERAAR